MALRAVLADDIRRLHRSRGRTRCDPEGEFANLAVFMAEVLAAVQQNLVDQDAADVDPDSLDGLIEVETWDQDFEFAHFSDEELLTALSALDASLGGRSPDQVRHHLAGSRARGHHIRHVWESWPSKPGKPRLAEMLWPVLRRNIDLARHGLADAPPIVAAVYEAHQAAIQARRTHFVLPRKQSRN